MTSKIAVWRALLGAVSAFLIITGGALVVTDPKSVTTKSEQEESQAVDAAAPGSSASPAETAPASGGAGEGAAGAPDSKTANAAAARPFGSPGPGKYRFKFTTSMSGREPSSRELVVQVSDASSNQTEVRQKVVFTSDEGSGDRETVWRAGGMLVLAESIETRGQKIQCDWEPDLPELKLPLKVGQEWTYESSCTMQGQGMSAKRHRTVRARVMEIGSAQVAGQTVEVYVIKDNATETFTIGSSSNTVETESTAQFASKFGINVRATQKSKSTFGTQSFESTSEFELQNIKPE